MIRTHDEASALFLVKLFPDIGNFLFECLATKLLPQYLDFLIWAWRSFVSPNTINQIYLNSDETRTIFLFQFLRQLASISYDMSEFSLEQKIENHFFFLRAVIKDGSTPTVLMPSNWSAVLLAFSKILHHGQMRFSITTIPAKLVHPPGLASGGASYYRAASRLD